MKKIVLTGGPCAGKSTALALLNEHLSSLGFNVILINESATELINSGIKPFGENSISNLEFQKIILNYQLQKERILGNVEFNNQKDTVIIYDRGVMDNKAYLRDFEFAELLKNQNLKYLALLDNYDLVIHLLTAACGAEQFYTLANNSARTETIEEAKLLDLKTQNAWLGHDDLRIVNNDTDFNHKMQKTINIIDSILQNKITRHQHKYLLDTKYLDNSLKHLKYNKFLIEQYYLLDKDNIYRIREKNLDNFSIYTLTVEQLMGFSKKVILNNQHLDKKTYYEFLKAHYESIRNIKKERLYFVYENQYFKIDKFYNGICLLELNSDNLLNIPKFLPIIADVTYDDQYYNYCLSKKIKY